MRATVFVMFACGSAPAPLHQEAKPSGPPQLFAVLFQPGKSWSFPTMITHGGDGPHETAHGNMTCKVESTSHTTVWTSTITCDGSEDELGETSRPAGIYVANDKGLWRFADTPQDPLDDTTMLIAAEPKAQVHEDMVPDQTQRDSTAILAHHGGWCVSQTSAAGDESGTMLCFRADVGFLGGGGFFAGGRSVDTTWGDTPH